MDWDGFVEGLGNDMQCSVTAQLAFNQLCAEADAEDKGYHHLPQARKNISVFLLEGKTGFVLYYAGDHNGHSFVVVKESDEKFILIHSNSDMANVGNFRPRFEVKSRQDVENLQDPDQSKAQLQEFTGVKVTGGQVWTGNVPVPL